MGYLRKQYTCSMALGAPNIFNYDLFEGILYSLSVSIHTSGCSPNQGFCTAGIADSDGLQQACASHLIVQHFGHTSPAFFEGRFPIITGTYLNFNVYAPINTVLYIAWLQLMPSDELPARLVLDA